MKELKPLEAPKVCQVRKDKRGIHYTVTVADRLWIQDSIRKMDLAWEKKAKESRAERRKAAAAIVSGESKPTLSEVEKAELAYRAARNAPPKPTEAQKAHLQACVDELFPEPRKGLIDHFKSICSKVWNNAFDSER